VNGQICTDGSSTIACASEFGVSVRQQAYGLEGILASGPFKLVGEYSGSYYQGNSPNLANNVNNKVSYDAITYYVEGGWFITGEKYASSYKNGVFSSFKPINDFDLDKGNWGAVEALFRFEEYQVGNVWMTQAGNASNDAGRIQGSINGGPGSGGTSSAKTYTGGVRWILNPNVVLKANYGYTKFGDTFAPIDVTGATNAVKDEHLFAIRTQFMF
jgi:phosphate-selective porin OprO/OprP